MLIGHIPADTIALLMADRLDEILARLDDLLDHVVRRQDQTDDILRFVSEMNRRSEVALQDLLRSQREMRREIRAETAEIKASTAEIQALTETTKAHTRAIFAVIDRLEGGGGPALAG